jgi:hypothetical protein
VQAADERRATRPEPPPSPVEALLSLQRSAGNRAVGDLLARAPEEVAANARTAARCTISGVGSLVLESYSVGPEVGGATGGKTTETLVISATTKVGRHTSKLQGAVAVASRHTVELVDRGASWSGTEGVLVSYQTMEGHGGEPYESWALRIDAPAEKPR